MKELINCILGLFVIFPLRIMQLLLQAISRIYSKLSNRYLVLVYYAFMILISSSRQESIGCFLEGRNIEIPRHMFELISSYHT